MEFTLRTEGTDRRDVGQGNLVEGEIYLWQFFSLILNLQSVTVPWVADPFLSDRLRMPVYMLSFFGLYSMTSKSSYSFFSNLNISWSIVRRLNADSSSWAYGKGWP
jgi:hypothetical protein